LQALRTGFVTSTILQTRFLERYNTRISQDTVRRRLRETELRPYVPATGPLLTPVHRRVRVKFAREHVDWDIASWSSVLFSDESRFSLVSNDRGVRVYRRPGERYAPCNIVGTVQFGGGSVLVWGGISLEARTELVVKAGRALYAHGYVTTIVEPHVIPFAPFIGDQFVFMHDNARPHIAGIVRDYLEETNITTMVWPARSPDLNPIEPVWDMLGRRLRASDPRPNSLAEARNRLVEIWENLDQNDIRAEIESMQRRCQAVIRARGGNTRY
jgi:hypothetical protein